MLRLLSGISQQIVHIIDIFSERGFGSGCFRPVLVYSRADGIRRKYRFDSVDASKIFVKQSRHEDLCVPCVFRFFCIAALLIDREQFKVAGTGRTRLMRIKILFHTAVRIQISIPIQISMFHQRMDHFFLMIVDIFVVRGRMSRRIEFRNHLYAPSAHSVF